MQLIVISLFTAYILHYEINIGYYLRELFNLKHTKHYKLLDCFPCQSFWISLAITLDPIKAMFIYLISIIYDKLNTRG